MACCLIWVTNLLYSLRKSLNLLGLFPNMQTEAGGLHDLCDDLCFLKCYQLYIYQSHPSVIDTWLIVFKSHAKDVYYLFNLPKST